MTFKKISTKAIRCRDNKNLEQGKFKTELKDKFSNKIDNYEIFEKNYLRF